MKRALITGVSGQDGAHLARLLLGRDYEVHGTYFGDPEENRRNLRELGIDGRVHLVALDLAQDAAIRRLVEEVRPAEVYNLAAQSSVAASFEEPLRTAEIGALGPLRLLEALRTTAPEARFFQASSCEMFGRPAAAPQSETTPFAPCNPYGAAKLFAHWTTVGYRQAYGLFACSGLLFNHESPLRDRRFVTRKIADGVARIKLGLQDRLVLGNLDARRDWGYAAEYVEAMWRMLQQNRADDFVIASGETHSVRDFTHAAFLAADIRLEWTGAAAEERAVDAATGRTRVEVSPDLFRPLDAHLLVGDAGKARRELKWQSKTTFEELARLMVRADLDRVAAEVGR